MADLRDIYTDVPPMLEFIDSKISLFIQQKALSLKHFSLLGL